jgi:hypothetical protein
MQPVRQQSHRVATGQAQKALDPDDDPACFNKPPDLAGVHAMAYQLESTLSIPGSLTAEDTKQGMKNFARNGVRALGAELLDSKCEAM